MPLFGFADIKIEKGSSNRRGPLRALQGSEFEGTTLRYPLDVGNYDKSHYVVFFVREQKNTSFKRSPASGNSFASSGGASLSPNSLQNVSTNFGNEFLGKINSGLGQINSAVGGSLSGITSSISQAAGSIVGNIGNIFGQSNVSFAGNSGASQQIIDNSIKKITNSNFLNTTTLTKDAIALYMPDTLNYTYSQSYDQLNIGGELGGQILAAGSSALEKFRDSGAMEALGSVAKSGALATTKKAFDTAGGLLGSSQTAQLAFTAATGAVQNPMLEMIYKSPNFRQFQFDFVFYPRDETEAYEVQRIIERFRFHQAPEFVKGSQGFLIPPSEFDIKFYCGGAQNPNIPQIATCVLTTIDTNYAPNGWSAYEVPGDNTPAIGRTGMPVSIQISLQFQEITYLTKRDFTSDNDFEDRIQSAL